MEIAVRMYYNSLLGMCTWCVHFFLCGMWQDESSLIHTDSTKKPVFSAEQVAILEEYRDSGMVSTAHVCQPWIQQAASATGLTEKQVKVNNCVQLMHCQLFAVLATFSMGLHRFVPFTIWCIML